MREVPEPSDSFSRYLKNSLHSPVRKIDTSFSDRIHEGYSVSYVARLWGVVGKAVLYGAKTGFTELLVLLVYNRYETHYGQEQSRLSRDTSILVDKYQEPQWACSLVSAITLRTSVPYTKRLNELFVDNVVYGCDWNSFMTSTVKGWWMTAAQSTILLL